MQRVLILGLVALLWGAVAIAVIGILTLTNHHWSAVVSYLLTATTVAGAWAATVALLRRGRLRCPYLPGGALFSKRR